jgi:sarcosine oxidase subunit gamma
MVLPQGACRTEAEGLAFARTGPEVWLAMRDSGDGFAEFLADEIGAAASVSDQSAGYAVLRLSGPKVVENLAKIIPVDLHPRAFKPGDVASTVASHIGVTLWRSEDAPDGSPVFYVAVFRSFAAGFWQALAESAAEFGFASESPG